MFTAPESREAGVLERSALSELIAPRRLSQMSRRPKSRFLHHVSVRLDATLRPKAHGVP